MKKRAETSAGGPRTGKRVARAARPRTKMARVKETRAEAKKNRPAAKGTPAAAKVKRAAAKRSPPVEETSTWHDRPLAFFGREWAQAVREAVNGGPTPAARAKKIERFWEWIERAKPHVNCQLGLAVIGLPSKGRRTERDCLLLDLEGGRCVRARLVAREDAERRATYLLSGTYDDWRQIMGGFDMGKAVMYRKLLLEKGHVLEFFKSIYFWTESLACIQRIPTAMPGETSRPN